MNISLNIIKFIIIDLVFLLIGSNLDIISFSYNFDNIFLRNTIKFILLLYSSYRLRQISFKYNNPNHIFVDMIVVISYSLCFLLKIIPIIFFHWFLYNILYAIKISYILYRTADLRIIKYNNYIDFFNNNMVIFISKSAIFIGIVIYYDYIHYIIPLSYIYILALIMIQPFIKYNNHGTYTINLFYIPELILNTGIKILRVILTILLKNQELTI